ncbi:hypothetical protein SDC9_161779 [bioreactor metagenome]|uniref:Uncharacterized protein n=1 Tax=bioreactor metagenome TaxID=1076179 RepID=A0A645FLM4_9ZZZZ
MRQLILADRDDVRLAEENVRGLVHREGEHQSAHRTIGIGQLVLDRGVTAQLGVGDQRQKRQQQLVQWGNRRVRKDRRARRVDAHRQVVGDGAVHIRLEVTDPIAVVDHLIVGDQHP